MTSTHTTRWYSQSDDGDVQGERIVPTDTSLIREENRTDVTIDTQIDSYYTSVYIQHVLYIVSEGFNQWFKRHDEVTVGSIPSRGSGSFGRTHLRCS